MTEDSFIRLLVPNEETGKEEEKYVSVSLLFSRLWEDYIRDMIPDDYMRGMLMDLGLNDADVSHMMLRLKAGKAEFEAGDYREVSYI
jgi:hypothetical protein